jgi:lipid A 3-O-deacylase
VTFINRFARISRRIKPFTHRRTFRRCTFATMLAIFFSLPGIATAQPRCEDTDQALNDIRKYEGTYKFTLDNDLFANTDRDYTNGVKVAWSSPNLRSFVDDPCLPQWLQRAGWVFDSIYPIRIGKEEVEGNVTVTLGQAMFTPRNRTSTDLIVDDRPYAGWTYLGFGYNTRSSFRLDSYEINFGVVGPWSRAKESQDLIHRARGIDKFQGWSNQLGNEFGAQVVFERKYRYDFFDQEKSRASFGLDLIPHAGISLGNVATYANAGFEVRAGWGLPDDFGTSPIRPAGDNSSPRAKQGLAQFTRDLGAHVFISVDGRAVARNIFLDGNSIRDSHSVDKKPFVADVVAGVAFNVKKYKLAFVRVYRTREFAGQATTPRYGSITISGPL